MLAASLRLHTYSGRVKLATYGTTSLPSHLFFIRHVIENISMLIECISSYQECEFVKITTKYYVKFKFRFTNGSQIDKKPRKKFKYEKIQISRSLQPLT